MPSPSFVSAAAGGTVEGGGPAIVWYATGKGIR